MTLREFRERVNVHLYSSKETVLRVFRVLNFLVSTSALVLLAAFYGFPHESDTADLLLQGVTGSFIFYVFHYVVRVVYEFHPWTFIKRTWFEALVMSILVVEGASDLLTGHLLVEPILSSMGIESVRDVYTLFIQGYFFLMVSSELLRQGNILPRFRLNPALIFIISFFAIISLGTVLLMLPEMTTIRGGMPWVDALFTSTSATCVTGLMLVDTVSYFTFKGQMVLLILIQLGGLNLIAFGSFLALASRFGLGVKQHDVIEDFVNRDNVHSSSGMLRKVVFWCLGIEAAGAAAFFATLNDQAGVTSMGDQLFYSVFHSVSAFNNAGISLFTNGLAAPEVATNWAMHWVITVLVFLGALGMMALFDIFDPSRLRERMIQPWKQIGFATKIALYFSIGLVGVGSVAFFLLEQDGTLSGLSWWGKVTTSVFQSATRTSGFNTVDIGAVGIPMLFLITILMFIGSSSSSTGGGIKTSTLAIVLADVRRTIRGFEHVQLFKRTIPELLRSRAYSVLLFFLIGNLVCIFALSITEAEILAQEGRNLLDLTFEQVSAMGTVGLSTGITPELSTAGKFIIAASMFVGRVGTLTVAFAIGGRLVQNHFKYPEGHTMVG
jgi:trk system potassium uptake protein TrkH